MKYIVTAMGRRVGAIGIFHAIAHEVEATSREDALLKTYDVYEHLMRVEVRPVCPNCAQWQHPPADDCVNACRKRGFVS